MKAFKFEEAVEKVAKERGVSLYDSHRNLMREIKKEMEGGLITAKEAVEKLEENNKDFRMHFEDKDFIEIEKEIR